MFDLEKIQASIQERKKNSISSFFPSFLHPLIPGPNTFMCSQLSKQALVCTFHARFRVGGPLVSERVSGGFACPFAHPPFPFFSCSNIWRLVHVSVVGSGLWLVEEWQWRVLREIWRTKSASHNSNNVSVSGSARPVMAHPKCPRSPRAWQRPTDLIPLLVLAAVGLQLCVCVCEYCPTVGF